MSESINAVGLLLERLSALQRNLMRRFAAEEGLQFVHVEILEYLSICNRYSDTTQAISEYLGQTKGSISQSLGYLEEGHFIKRTQDKTDKRVFHISLAVKGQAVAERLFKSIDLDGAETFEPSLKSLLASIQKKNGSKGFGQCASCKHNQSNGKNSFICGLTKEKLSIDDAKKICREFEAG